MDRASAIASFALVTALFLSATSFAAGRATRTVASKSDTEPAAATATAENAYSVGVLYWEEPFQLVGPDGTKYAVTGSNWAVSFGFDHHDKNKEWGWLYGAQAFIGQNQSQSQDDNLVFFKNHENVFGVEGIFGGFHSFENHLTLGLGLAIMYRHISLSAPDTYSLSAFSDAFPALLQLEMTFPLGSKVELVQRLGFSVLNRSAVWYVGARL